MAKRLAEALAAEFREAAGDYSSDDVRAHLQNALPDGCCVCHVYGDDSDGDVVYTAGYGSSGGYKKAPYSMGQVGGKRNVSVDTGSAVEVLPHMTYDELDNDEDDNMSAMESSRKRALGLYERFVSQGERNNMSKSDFAGKGQSFPINKPGDVMAAVRSLGRAGAGNYSSDTIKANIKKIATRKGYALPKSMQDDSSSESLRDIELSGDMVPLREGAVASDGTVMLKLIAPGWGSSGYYSKEVLKRDGPKIFTAGTKTFWDHPTSAEEAARPEGSLHSLVGALKEDAHYEDDGPDGSGLYSRSSVAQHFQGPVNSLAKNIGMSIRAYGSAKEGQAEGRKGAIIEKLTRAQSVDYVTTPGAGGKVLQLFEAARSAQPLSTNREGSIDDMDEATVQRLVETAVQKAVAPLQADNRKLLERLVVATEAPRLLDEALARVNLPPASQRRVRERCLGDIPLKENGKLDDKKFGELIEAQVKDEGTFLAELSGGRFVAGMSSAPITDPKQLEKVIESEDDAFKEVSDQLADMMILGGSGEKDEVKRRRKAFREGRAA